MEWPMSFICQRSWKKKFKRTESKRDQAQTSSCPRPGETWSAPILQERMCDNTYKVIVTNEVLPSLLSTAFIERWSHRPGAYSHWPYSASSHSRGPLHTALSWGIQNQAFTISHTGMPQDLKQTKTIIRQNIIRTLRSQQPLKDQNLLWTEQDFNIQTCWVNPLLHKDNIQMRKMLRILICKQMEPSWKKDTFR